MKSTRVLLFAFSVFVSTAALAIPQGDLIKTCNTVVKVPEALDEPVGLNVSIFKNGSELNARIVIIRDSGRLQAEQDFPVTKVFGKIRDGLGPITSPEGLNDAELMIGHAMSLVSDPEMADMKEYFDSGVDLAAVRSANVYYIEDGSKMFRPAVVETFDGAGNNLGSFLGGPLVSACK